MSNKIKIAIIAAGIVLVFFTAYLFFNRGGDESLNLSSFKFLNFPNSKSLNPEAPKFAADSEAPAGEGETGVGFYTNDAYGFSFRYPDGFRVENFAEGEGEIILVSGPKSGEGFQIYVTPFDEEGPITAERIRRDLPKMAIDQPQEAGIGEAQALAFFSSDSSLGRTREAWFVWPESPIPNGNYLYQVSASSEFDLELSKIMATFRFAE